MELKEIRQIVELMQKHDLTHFELEREGQKLKLKKGADLDAVGDLLRAMPAVAPAAPIAAPAAAAVPAAAADGGAAPAPAPTGTFIESPMVGTFYRRSDPEAPALVDVGTKVDKNTTVCLIEAMKVFNEIKADATGTITKILVDDGSPVQFGEALFEIDPA